VERTVAIVSEVLAATAEGDVVDAAVAAQRARSLMKLVKGASTAGRVDLALALLARETRLGPLLDGDPIAAAGLLWARAWGKVMTGDIGAYCALIHEAIGHFERSGDHRALAQRRHAAGYALMRIGRYDEAERILRRALADTERIGLPLARAYALENLGLTLAYLGRLDEARAVEEEAIVLFERLVDLRMVAGARIYLGMIHALAGDPAGAEREARRVLGAEGVPSSFRPLAVGVLAGAALAQGRLAEGLAAAEEAMDLLRALQGLEEGEPGVRLVHAEALVANGKRDEARRALDEARTRLLARAELISEPELRKSFLENVPEHARTLALAAAWHA
jgi:tetratricopeptide (TPR) repeat protein